MGDQGRWFKLWTTAPDDPQLGTLPVADFGRWCKFGAYLKVHGKNGVIHLHPPLDGLPHPLQGHFQVESFDSVLTCIRRFPNCLVTSVTDALVTTRIEWLNWPKYQGDFSNDRVTKFREKHANRVTPKKRREEEETKKRESPPTPAPPTDWKLNPALQAAVEQTRFRAFLGDEAWWTSQFRAFEIRFAEEVARAEAWCRSNPGRAPKRDLRRFLHTWFSRTQERQTS